MDHPNAVGTALQDRVRDEHTDLEKLLRTATRTGTRIRRRRRTAATAGAAAGVAAIVVGGALLAGSNGTPRGGPDLASQPTAAASHPVEPAAHPERQTREARAHARAQRALRGAPIYVDSPDWRCDRPADEKFSCSQGGASVVVNWRPAAIRADYQDPAKAGPETYVSEVHGELFATVAPGPAATAAQVSEVGRALVWADSRAE